MAAPNPTQAPQDLPEYVRFSPQNHEVILLLKRFIRKEDMPTCAVKFLTDSDLQDRVARKLWSEADFPYFEKDQYWYFLDRKASKDKKKVDRSLGSLGTWKARGKSTKIYSGALLVGIKQKFELMKGSVKTGWCKFEYTRYSKKFEKTCVSHLIFASPEVEEYASDISEEEETPTDEEDEEHNEEEQGVQGPLGNLDEETHADGGEDQTQDQEEDVHVDDQTQVQDKEVHVDQTQVQDEEVRVDQTQVQDEQVPVDKTVHELVPWSEEEWTQFLDSANEVGLSFEVNEAQELMVIAEAPADDDTLVNEENQLVPEPVVKLVPEAPADENEE